MASRQASGNDNVGFALVFMHLGAQGRLHLCMQIQSEKLLAAHMQGFFTSQEETAQMSKFVRGWSCHWGEGSALLLQGSRSE